MKFGDPNLLPCPVTILPLCIGAMLNTFKIVQFQASREWEKIGDNDVIPAPGHARLSGQDVIVCPTQEMYDAAGHDTSCLRSPSHTREWAPGTLIQYPSSIVWLEKVQYYRIQGWDWEGMYNSTSQTWQWRHFVNIQLTTGCFPCVWTFQKRHNSVIWVHQWLVV